MNDIKPKSISSVGADYDDKHLYAYLKHLRTIPPMDAEEEAELVARKEAGDIEAAQKLIVANLWFVAYTAKQYTGYKLPMIDIIQEGNIGLMKAVKKFSSEHGVRITSYAVHWIKSEIHEYVIKNSKIMTVATTKQQRKLFFKLKSHKKHHGGFTEEEVKEIAKTHNVRESDVRTMEERLYTRDVSYEQPSITHSDSSETTGLDNSAGEGQLDYTAPKNTVFSSSILEPSTELEIQDDETHMRSMILDAVENLSAREKDIIKSRWIDNLDNKPTLTDLSIKYGVSAERIRQLEKQALGRIREWITN
jgi:RNA polymerase sigma-32 factor